MFSKALFATDLSPASDAVLEYLKLLQPLGCREVVLAYVIYVKHTVGLAEVMQDEAAPGLEAQKKTLEAEGFRVSVETPVGVPGPTITRLAVERGCSLIVVGSHGHSMASDIALGSVATDVVHRSELPVLVVRLKILEEEGKICCRVLTSDVLGHVLYATDFSDNAERAFQYVEKLVQSGCRMVTLLHVQDIRRISPHLEHKLEEFNAIDQARLERLKERLHDLGAEEVNTEIPYGHPAKEILHKAEDQCFSIIVMGTHGRGFIADLFIGSVSHNVVRYSPVPVLLIPPIH